MKLLVLNPNTSESVTERIAAAARAAASPGTEIVPMTAQWGVPYIVTRAEAAIATCAALEVMAEHVDGHDAIVLAAFGDPGLDAARELMPVPVIGLSEGSMLTACMLARRFSLVSISPDFTPWYRDSVERLGLQSRLASVRALEEGFDSIAHVQEEKEAMLLSLCRRAAEDDGADIVILAGAPLAGLAARLTGRVPIPVLDGVAAAVRQAEALAAFPPGPAALRRPAGSATKPVTGVSPAVQRLFQGGTSAPVSGS